MHLLLRIKVFPENMGIGLNKKYFFRFLVVLKDITNLGSDKKLEKSSTLGLYWTVNKTIRNLLLVTFQEPLTRRFQNTLTLFKAITLAQ